MRAIKKVGNHCSRQIPPVKFAKIVEKPLTPNLLILMPLNDMILILPTYDESFDRNRFYQIKHLANVFWKRWINPYLPTISHRTKWLDKSAIEDIVLVIDETSPRAPRGVLGILTEIIMGTFATCRCKDPLLIDVIDSC